MRLAKSARRERCNLLLDFPLHLCCFAFGSLYFITQTACNWCPKNDQMNIYSYPEF